MPEASSAVDTAIKKLVETYQDLADEEKAAGPKREAAKQKIEKLVDDFAGLGTFDESKVSSEMIAAFMIFQQTAMQRMMMGDPSAQMAMAKFNEGFLEDFQGYMATIQMDPQKGMEIENAARSLTADMRPPKVQTSMPTIEIAVEAPEDEYGEWTFAVVPIVIDENFKASVAETLDFDLYVSLEVTPREGLSEQFNIPGTVYKAGEKIEPVSITHETEENGPQTMLHVKGHVYKDGAYVQELNFPPIPMEKRDPNALDMESLMQMMRAGPGPNGLN